MIGKSVSTTFSLERMLRTKAETEMNASTGKSRKLLKSPLQMAESRAENEFITVRD